MGGKKALIFMLILLYLGAEEQCCQHASPDSTPLSKA